MDKLDIALQKEIGFKPHPAQKKILECKAKDIVICAGRRFGKSSICAYVALKTILKAEKEGKPVKIWIVAPTYELTQKVFEYIVKWFLMMFPQQGKWIKTRPFPKLQMYAYRDGNEYKSSWIECKSADSPNSLLGEEVDLLIVDECSRIKKDVYESYLYPTTVSRRGQTFMISTPFGKNWFYDQWVMAKEHGAAFQLSSRANPFFPEEEWEKAKRTLPRDVFEQEFLATFKEDAAAVFRNVRGVIKLNALSEPVFGHRYVMGLDLAKFRDFTVITIIDKATHDVVFWDRFQKIPYTLQKERIMSAARRYHNALIVIDSLNVGASMADDLRAEGMRVKDFKSTGSVSKDWARRGSKERLIERLAAYIEERNISIPPEEVLIDELEAFGYQMTDAGRLKYEAPTGLHDDAVISLALAVWTLPLKAKKQSIRAKRSTNYPTKTFVYD